MAFENFSQRRDQESCGDLSWEDFLDKPEDLSELVSPSSVVTEFRDSFFCCTEWELMEPQSFSFSFKRVTQEEVRFEGSQVEAPPLSRRRMMPHHHLKRRRSTSRRKTRCGVRQNTKHHLEESKSLKVEIEELESLLGPDDTEVDFRRILEEARIATFETFSTGPSEFLVSRSRWDKHQKEAEPWRQNSSASSSERQWQEGLEA